MIKTRWITGLVLSLAAICAQAAEINVSLENPPSTGTVVALVFDAADEFADLRDPLTTQVLPMDGTDSISLGNLPPGDYAVMVFHDENGNGELDKNFIGIPREPLGFSNQYWAKGKPTFSGAAFTVGDEEEVPIDIKLKKIFGKKGLFGVGVGVLAKTSPYRGSDSIQVQPIPAITYIGERIQILGPLAQVGLTSWKGTRLALTGRYRLGAYDEDDSDVLEGMGDRKDSFFAGLALQTRLPEGLRVSAGFEYDVLDRVGGGYGELGLRRSWQVGWLLVVPSVSLNWMTEELADHEFGVTAEEAREDRPEYSPGDALNIEPGLGLSAEFLGSWRLMFNLSAEFLASDLRNSPLVDEFVIWHGFAALNYTF